MSDYIDNARKELAQWAENIDLETYTRQLNTWTHEGDALVSVMLLEGFKYIMCEIGEEDKANMTMGQETPRFIVEKYEDSCFVDVKGNMWQHAQAINNDGTVMTYDDYLMLKQLKEVKHGRLE